MHNLPFIELETVNLAFKGYQMSVEVGFIRVCEKRLSCIHKGGKFCTRNFVGAEIKQQYLHVSQ